MSRLDIESYELSDEAMALVEETLRARREANPDAYNREDTAYKRSLRQQALLEDLERLGLKEWVRQGKKAEFDAITDEAIALSRKSIERDDAEVHVLDPVWTAELQKLRQKTRHLRLVK